MSRRHRGLEENHRTSGRQVRRRRRALGSASAAGAFLAFGVAPLAAAPAAYADDFGLLDLIDPSTWSTPFDGIDWASFIDPAAWASVADTLTASSTWDAALHDLTAYAAADGPFPAAVDQSSWSFANVNWWMPFGDGTTGADGNG